METVETVAGGERGPSLWVPAINRGANPNQAIGSRYPLQASCDKLRYARGRLRFHSGVALLLAALLAVGCAGPRMRRLDRAEYTRRPSIFPIEIYVGQVAQPYREVALIESTAFADDADATRLAQMEELKKKARRLGADAVQDVRILSKKVHGFTSDERTPIPSVRQGEYSLYFMRGTAIIFESSLPGSVGKGVGFASMKHEEKELQPPPAAEQPPSKPN